MSWYNHTDHRLIYVLIVIACISLVLVVVWN